ncbi:MAG: hypothetical protein GX200_01005 [Firmicutes bacterium]|nr:hypothetical protein [Bacillota bacterium]
MKRFVIIQPRFQIAGHMELVEATAEVMLGDGKTAAYRLLYSKDPQTGMLLAELVAHGSRDADLPYSGGYILTLWHFHHPWSHRGYLTRKSSADVFAGLCERAQKLWQAGETGRAAWQLGRALHLLQDIFIPQHSALTGCYGHAALEKWLTKDWKKYRVTSGGCYSWSREFCREDGTCHRLNSQSFSDWIDLGAHLSFPWFESYFAKGGFTEETFRQVAPLVIPHVLRFSAGFLQKIFTDLAAGAGR